MAIAIEHFQPMRGWCGLPDKAPRRHRHVIDRQRQPEPAPQA